MRDKLIEIARDFCRYEKCSGKENIEICKSCENGSKLADHLLANNVFVLPEQMKDSWELALPFMMRLFVADEAEIEKMKGEFELQKVKKILTDIRDYLAEKKKICDFTWDLEREMLLDTLLADLTEYAEKLGVEL